MWMSRALLLSGLLLPWGITRAQPQNGGLKSKARFRLTEEVQSQFSVYRDGDSVDTLCSFAPLQMQSLEACSFNTSNPLVLIIHGWSLDGIMEDWVVRLASALKVHLGGVNVLVCNWIPLAQRFYPVAARNTRVVGQEVALLLNWLEVAADLPLRRVHLIGYSLGAHVAGLAGSFFSGSRRLGRISGLDPAGPMFEGAAAADRLSPDDALFVDAIHTFTKSHMVLSVGIQRPVGHLDFYPNGGTLQPGCTLSDMGNHISQHGLRGVSRVMKCAHERSISLFIDSLLHTEQQITAFRCRDNKAFSQGLCLDCKKNRCTALGYRTHRASGGTSKRFYLRTRSHMPYRVFHYQLRVQLVEQMKLSWASVSVTLKGQQGESKDLPLSLPAELRGNVTLSFLVTVEEDVGWLEGVTLHWGQRGVLVDMWHRMRTIMPWGQPSGPVLRVGKVRVKAGETQDKMFFCSDSSFDHVTLLQPWTNHTFHRCPKDQSRLSQMP